MSEINEKEQLLQMINGYMISQALRCVCELEIADKLASGPKTVEQLSDSTVLPKMRAVYAPSGADSKSNH